MTKKFIEYLFTNESLDSIVKGLRIRKTDKVLSCGGSGDQAFALLEEAESVRVLEINPAQAVLIEKRKQLLKNGDCEGFLADNPLGDSQFYVEAGLFPQYRNNRNRYFQKGNRLGDIRSKLDDLEIVEGDLTMIGNQRYDKIYLSNVLSYRNSECLKSSRAKIISFSKMLGLGGLIYVSNSDIFNSYDFFPDLICDDQQSYVADHHNRLAFEENTHWNPAVFVKMLEKVSSN